MAQSERTVRLLEAVDTLLTDFGEPLYYKELCQVLIDSGMWVPWGQQPDQILYSAIHNDIKRHGNGLGRFLFMGEGIFCSTSVDGAADVVAEGLVPIPENNITPKDPFKRPGDMPGDADRRREQAEWDDAHRKCWNCASMRFDGPNMHRHELGTCCRPEDTGRHCIHHDTEACELWRQRTPTQRENDRLIPIDLITEALHIFVTGGRSKGSRWT